MSWKDRLLARNYRKIITKLNKSVSKIKTTKAETSICAEYKYVIRDIIKISIELLSNQLRKNKQILNFDDKIFAFLRQKIKLVIYIKHLKKIGLLHNNLKSNDIPKRYLGRVITLGMLIESIWDK